LGAAGRWFLREGNSVPESHSTRFDELKAALTDPLTELYNRRYALERLDQEWSLSARTGEPLACLILDIDHFKRINDTYGHDVGDCVLRLTAGALRDLLRQNDVVCRLGGEEFVLIGPGMTQGMAAACAERLRAGLEARVIEVPGGQVRVTLSIGVAVRTADTASPAELLKAADEAVYAAKKAGRNRVCLPPEGRPQAVSPTGDAPRREAAAAV
jgi:diguanylate cyclase (GGDEF)-like protein